MPDARPAAVAPAMAITAIAATDVHELDDNPSTMVPIHIQVIPPSIDHSMKAIATTDKAARNARVGAGLAARSATLAHWSRPAMATAPRSAAAAPATCGV